MKPHTNRSIMGLFYWSTEVYWSLQPPNLSHRQLQPDRQADEWPLADWSAQGGSWVRRPPDCGRVAGPRETEPCPCQSWDAAGRALYGSQMKQSEFTVPSTHPWRWGWPLTVCKNRSKDKGSVILRFIKSHQCHLVYNFCFERILFVAQIVC